MGNVIQQLKNQIKKPVLIFDHGLGDFIHFLPVFKELERQTNMDLILASSRSRQFHELHPKVMASEDIITQRNYGLIYKVIYPDTKSFTIPFEIYDEPSKPYLCAYYEFGMSFFVWEPHRIKRTIQPQNRVGVHFFGHTGTDHKFCPTGIAARIWNEIEEAGYEPFECHMRPDFRSRYRDCGSDEACFIPDHQTIRNEKPSLATLRDTISTCKYFIGVDSGPLYLATSILGHENTIGLENQKRVSYYCPKHINTVSIREYENGSVYNRLKLMEVAK